MKVGEIVNCASYQYPTCPVLFQITGNPPSCYVPNFGLTNAKTGTNPSGLTSKIQGGAAFHAADLS